MVTSPPTTTSTAFNLVKEHIPTGIISEPVQTDVIRQIKDWIANTLDPESQIQYYFLQMCDELQNECRVSRKYFWIKEPGAEILKDMKITIVEDTPEVIHSKYPNLLANTEGKARYIYVNEHTETKHVADKLFTENPDVILMDQDLTKIKRNPETKIYDQLGSTKFGTDIIEALRARWYTGIIIWTSSDSSNHEKMILAWANGCFDKSEHGFIQTVARIISEHN